MSKSANNKLITVILPQKGKQNLPINKAMQLASTWLKQQQFPVAIHLLAQITEQLPSQTLAWVMLFDALEQQGDVPALEKASIDCLKKKSRFVPALMSLAIAQRMQLQHQQALATIEKAIKLEPRNRELYNILGIIYKEQGQNSLALEAFNKCLKINPKHSAAIWNKSDLDQVISNEEFKRILTLADSNTVKARDRAKLYYALARSNHGTLTPDIEFELIDKGAQLMRDVSTYNHANELALIKSIPDYFTGDSGAIYHKGGDNTDTNSQSSCPIFICGLPRSGTTLVEQILSSHPEITAGDELNDLPIATSKVLKRAFIKQPFPEWSNQLEAEDWQLIADFYLKSTKEYQTTSYFTDKNLMNYKAIGVIRKALPQAKIIICKRNPMDNIWGCYRQYFSNGLTFTYNLEELAEIVKTHNQLVAHWKAIGVPFLEVQYEDLVAQSETEIQKLLDYIGLDFDESCLKFYENQRNVRTTSATQVRQPLSDKKVGYWKKYKQQLKHVSELFESDN